MLLHYPKHHYRKYRPIWEAVCLDFLRTINEEVKRGASCSNNDAFYNSKASLLIVRGIVVVILPDNNDALEKD